MTFIEIIILAIVQALTEFIPVSSSGHLLAIEQITSIESSLAVDVMLHFGTLIALVGYFWKKLLTTAQDFLSGKNPRLGWNIITSTIPAALAGFFLDDVLADARAINVVIIMLVVVGLVMIFENKLFAGIKKKTIAKLQRIDALSIGLAQALALIPGTSRSGITMIAGRARGLDSKSSAEYSFLIGIPIIAGATAKVLTEDSSRDYLSANTLEALVGVGVAAVVGVVVLKFLLRFVAKNGLKIFGWYRLLLAFILFIIEVSG